MTNKRLDRLEKKLDGIMLLILFVGLSLFGLFSILFLVMFFNDMVNYRFFESIISFLAFAGSFIIFIKMLKLNKKMLKKLDEETTKDGKRRDKKS